jgi:flavin reductase (DIM6/NTAB) family NADH-FMN oxidoreductase RutF
MSRLNSRKLREALGSFLTGVTVATTVDAEGMPRGFTANSFTSVSLDPPLLLVCIDKTSAGLTAFLEAEGFAVSILAESQQEVSAIFASKRVDRFGAVAWRKGPLGNPVIEGAVAWFDCLRHDVVDAGDHVILIGRVVGFDRHRGNPLGYVGGGYVSLGLETAAVDAASAKGRTVVGAILEAEKGLLFLDDAVTGGLSLPEVGRYGQPGCVSLLQEKLEGLGFVTALGFLYAVFETPKTRMQSIYYRGCVAGGEAAPVHYASIDAIAWDKLPDDAVRDMLRR